VARQDLKGSVMTDSEMDKVTAAGIPEHPGLGVGTAETAGGHVGNANVSFPATGFGRCTAAIHGGNVGAACGS
jgi:hypothetical protein